MTKGRFEELEKENKTMRSEIGIAKGYIERVEKENAGLKEHLKRLIVGMYHIAQHHPTMGAHTKIMQDLREAEQFLSEVEK